MTYVPVHWLIPGCDIFWGVFTLLQFRVNSYAELVAYRLLIGWFEAAFFPAMHYVFGSWYRGHEIARRGGIFYTGLGLGTLTAGLIQAGASQRLEGVHGTSNIPSSEGQEAKVRDRPRRLEMAVYHMRRHHPPNRYPRLLRHSRHR